MKIVPSRWILAALSLSDAMPAVSAPKMPAALLVDMYAVREGDQYVVHVVASGDITRFLSDRKLDRGSYLLTLDVPAVSPAATKFDIATPFSRRFQVWPMMLGKKVYSRIEIELDRGASSVVGLQNSSHLFVRIHKELPPSMQVAEAAAPPPPARPACETEPMAPEVVETVTPRAPSAETTVPDLPPSSSSEGTEGDEDDLFFSLFPAPARERHTLFKVAAEDALYPEEASQGLRLGRFVLRPSVDASWIHGGNLLQESAEPFVDDAYLVRARVNARLLESAHDVRLTYEARYRDYQDFDIEDNLTHFFDVSSNFEITPTTSARIGNHFVHGSFESQEFDFGGEVVGSTDPFYRNATQAVLSFGFSERFGAEITGSYDTVEFREEATEFFDYDTRALGGTFVYDLSPVLSLTGEYVRALTPEPRERPMAGSVADLFLVGVRGELTPMLRGEIRAGYSKERFEQASVPQDFSGFVAEASLTRDIGLEAALIAFAGRRTNPSAFDQNGYYVSNYGRLQFISPFAENFRLTLSGALYRNDYPVADPNGIFRNDDLVSGGAGVAYFFNPLAFLSVDYRHDRRSSNLSLFSYRSNAVQMMVGFGFLNR